MRAIVVRLSKEEDIPPGDISDSARLLARASDSEVEMRYQVPSVGRALETIARVSTPVIP